MTKSQEADQTCSRDNEAKGWYLISLIRTTRGCHIQAEKRLLALSTLTGHANLYYGCWAAILTLLSLDSRFDYLAIPSACFASAVALWAMYASAEKYEIRARGFYDSYLELQRLWFRCERVEEKGVGNPDNENEVRRCQEDYSRILQSTENHSLDDYWSFCYDEWMKNRGSLEPAVVTKAIKEHRCQLIKNCVVRFMVYVGVPALLMCIPKLLQFAQGALSAT